MTSRERDLIDQLREDVHNYHLEVQAYIGKCDSYFKLTNQLGLDINGNPEDREGNPGLMARMGNLEKSRRVILGVAAGAWTIATILIGAVVSRLV